MGTLGCGGGPDRDAKDAGGDVGRVTKPVGEAAALEG
jgi:hypothetical protein